MSGRSTRSSCRSLTGALRAACEEMGAVLIRSAHSSNIKERRDASTALFDADGEMVMQAEHIPVHLGAMPAAVAAVLGEDHAPGVSWILNDPFAGGTHLPDITVITPVFGDARHELLGFAASRAHHADVGGRVPGSMPADSRTLEEEGVVIAPQRAGRADARASSPRACASRASAAPTCAPSWRPTAPGALRLRELASRVGAERLREATDAVLDYAERRTRACLAALPDGERRAEDVLEAPEGDLVLRLRALVDGRAAAARLRRQRAASTPATSTARSRSRARRACSRCACSPTPTSRRRPAPTGRSRCACPRARVLNARPGAAVAAGNVETSSRVADLVLGAFGRAQGQGTMNNLTLGDAGFSYYETLGGGQGACPDADGPSGVHVAMSNTLNTPDRGARARISAARRRVRAAPRLRRRRAPPRRRRRRARARGAARDDLLADRRAPPPRARAAPPAAPGARGRDLLDGAPLPGKATGTLRAGQRLRIETPRRRRIRRHRAEPRRTERVRSGRTRDGAQKHRLAQFAGDLGFLAWISYL